ncbi:MAG: restriction endonuclease subunit S, partial [Deltaproteobacteria bacterium]|nr:restriction endonuclease subunit S [Deltaproteobacteria bacterium]
MHDMPKGWIKTKLPELSDIIMGQSPPSSTYNTKGEGLPFFQGKAEFGNLYPKEIKYCVKPQKIAESGDILISVRAPVGPTNLCKEKSCIGRGLAALRTQEMTLSKYLLYYFRNIESWLSSQGTGSTFTAISKSDLEDIDVLLAPLPEQRRIVAKLEKLLTRVDACQERLNKIPALLKRFRQSVLAAACSGRLTSEWREKNGENPAEWSEVLLKEVAASRLGKMLDKSKNMGNPTRYLRNLNVRWFSVELTYLALMRVTPEEKDELSICDGDLFVCEGGEPGRCAVWNKGKTDIVFQKAIHRIRPSGNLSPHWLAFNIKNDADTGRLENYFTGTTIKHLTGKALAQYRFRLPLLLEQH